MNSCVSLPVFRCTSALNDLVTMVVFKHPMNALKRTMAAEYSRELGVTVNAGQRRLAQKSESAGTWIRITSDNASA
jgi:hypothetical protein